MCGTILETLEAADAAACQLFPCALIMSRVDPIYSFALCVVCSVCTVSCAHLLSRQCASQLRCHSRSGRVVNRKRTPCTVYGRDAARPVGRRPSGRATGVGWVDGAHAARSTVWVFGFFPSPPGQAGRAVIFALLRPRSEGLVTVDDDFRQARQERLSKTSSRTDGDMAE